MATATLKKQKYLCDSDSDREAIYPFPGECAIMTTDGTMYTCTEPGKWLKSGISSGGGGAAEMYWNELATQ